MGHRVKGFEATDIEWLENQVNNFLLKMEHEGKTLLDIKYSSVATAIAAHSEYGVYPEVKFTALVVYKES